MQGLRISIVFITAMITVASGYLETVERAPLGSFMQAVLVSIALILFWVFEGMSRPGFPLSWLEYWIPIFNERSQGGSCFVLSLLIFMSISRSREFKPQALFI